MGLPRPEFPVEVDPRLRSDRLSDIAGEVLGVILQAGEMEAGADPAASLRSHPVVVVELRVAPSTILRSFLGLFFARGLFRCARRPFGILLLFLHRFPFSVAPWLSSPFPKLA